MKISIPRDIIMMSVGEIPQEVAPMKLFEVSFLAFLFEIKITLDVKKTPQKKKRPTSQKPRTQSISQSTIIINSK